MVFGYHLIWTVYGVWLPNDPRGSTSRVARSDVIAELGSLHYGRKRVQPAGWALREFHSRAEQALRHDLLEFSPEEIRTVGSALGATIRRERYTCYACAVLPDHVHVLIRKHRDLAPAMIATVQADSRAWILEGGRREPDHPVWGGKGWAVFLDHPDDFRRTIGYIEDNPLKMGIPAQQWEFVKAYDGWPLHPGHSPASPHARSIRRRAEGGGPAKTQAE